MLRTAKAGTMPLHQHAAGVPCAHCDLVKRMPMHAANKRIALARKMREQWLGN